MGDTSVKLYLAQVLHLMEVLVQVQNPGFGEIDISGFQFENLNMRKRYHAKRKK
jgi:hypothetical protein